MGHLLHRARALRRRLATAEASGALSLKLGRAFKQIDTTAQLISDRHSVVSAVPVGRPLLGLVVTLEPFHVANAGFDPLPTTTTHITVADAAEIENLVTITDMPPGQLLLDRASDKVRSAWSLDTILADRARDRNPVLDEAWDSYPWAAAARAYASPGLAGVSERRRRHCARRRPPPCRAARA